LSIIGPGATRSARSLFCELYQLKKNLDMSAKYFRLTILGFTFWGSLLFFACSKKNDSGGGGGGSTGNGTF
jgi:hypothetical protein